MLWKPVLFTMIVYCVLGNENKLRLGYSGWRDNLLRILMTIFRFKRLEKVGLIKRYEKLEHYFDNKVSSIKKRIM